jgi:hypothetical protein
LKRRTIIGLTVMVVLALLLVLPLASRLQISALTPSELAAKGLLVPAPPDDSCDQIERAFAKFPVEKPVRNTNPFGADDVAIYKAIIELWNSNSRSLLDVASRTFPMDRDLSDCVCLKAIPLPNIANAARSFRTLTRDVLGGKNIRIVDPDTQALIVQTNDPSHPIREGKSIRTAVDRAFSTGLFSLSEIAFDKDHRRALVGYSFVCGSLCGSGGVWMFEKVDGVWKKSEHVCGGWIS